ncbi:MAG: response regulator [Bacteroidetes bacterium]|nr:MAG: response regulator [Bacteroidota bacterium]
MKKVLLIDDDDIYNFLNKSLVEMSGLSKQVQICKSAFEGISLLKALSKEELPDLILLDIMMPDMDGHGFLAEFVKLPETISKRTKIAMLTSSLDPDDKEKSFRYEAVIDFIEKPLNQTKLNGLKQKVT